jgi:hypothetical protein
MPDQLDFTGDLTTILGFVGVVSSAVILITAFRRFFNSPYNIRVKSQRFVDAAKGTFLEKDRDSNFPSENTIAN